ncbi:MAG: CvpA family protein [Comamonadaceae bacterium]|nr:CvpA family protein [Comamonadaceae bacterium]
MREVMSLAGWVVGIWLASQCVRRRARPRAADRHAGRGAGPATGSAALLIVRRAAWSLAALLGAGWCGKLLTAVKLSAADRMLGGAVRPGARRADRRRWRSFVARDARRCSREPLWRESHAAAAARGGA